MADAYINSIRNNANKAATPMDWRYVYIELQYKSIMGISDPMISPVATAIFERLRGSVKRFDWRGRKAAKADLAALQRQQGMMSAPQVTTFEASDEYTLALRSYVSMHAETAKTHLIAAMATARAVRDAVQDGRGTRDGCVGMA